MVESPSPAMSVLKRFLQINNFDTNIIYWNLKMLELQKEFTWWALPTMKECEVYSTLLFNNYLAVRANDRIAIAKIKSVLMSLKPQYIDVDSQFFGKHMDLFADKLDKFIDDELSKINFNTVLLFGISMSLYQWLCGSIIAHKIKLISPQTPIVIGGIGTRDSAVSFLRNFPQFDIAIWGEGEYNLVDIAKLIDNTDHCNIRIDSIPNVAYRNNNLILTTNFKDKLYADLNDSRLLPIFDDYFEQLSFLQNKDKTEIFLPIEGSRSCHWLKCHFCYLNSGYKHRLRNYQIIVSEIRALIKKHNIYKFSFLDNDIIGNDFNRFNSMLDALSSVKRDYPQFKIILAEVVTKGINASIVRKMHQAGFVHVQIGYESSSNELLKKIDKKNTFASNLLFIKFADMYGIYLGGVNIIRGLLEETDEDILESIENLRYLRFFYQHGKFRHNISNLGIMNSSRYFKKNSDSFGKFKVIECVDFLPEGYIKTEDIENCFIAEKICHIVNNTWSCFESVEKYYLKSSYHYKIYDFFSNIIYEEYLNGEIINKLEIEKKSLEYFILQESNESVLSFEYLMQKAKLIMNNIMTDYEVINILDELKREGLIYASHDYSEIVSVINIKVMI